MTQPHAVRGHEPGAERLSPFWRHVLQMFGIMVAGMIVAAAMFLTAVGMTWDEATARHPVGSLLVVAAGMTVPMTAWMLYRGMGRRNASEMAVAMVLPVIPFLFLVWFDVTETAPCGAYCLVGIGAMLGLMLFRRGEYSMERAGA